MKDIAKTVTIVILFVALVVTIAVRVMDSQDEKWYEKQVNNRYLYITFDDSGKHYEDTVDLYTLNRVETVNNVTYYIFENRVYQRNRNVTTITGDGNSTTCEEAMYRLDVEDCKDKVDISQPWNIDPSEWTYMNNYKISTKE